MTALSRRALARYAVDQLVMGQSPKLLAKRLSAALLASKKAAEADLFLDDIAYELESRGKLAQAVVTSASALSAQLKRQLTAAVKKAVKVEHVALTEKIDENVLGGFRVETAAHSWDKTIKRYLTEIKEGANNG